MDTQFASEFVSDALEKLGHDVPAEVLYPIMGDLHRTLDVREDLACRRSSSSPAAASRKISNGSTCTPARLSPILAARSWSPAPRRVRPH